MVTLLLVIVLLLACSAWVLQDARAREASRRPVTATVAGVTIDRAEIWAVLCLLLCVLFIPMYLVARAADG